jgi:hypothetical protein
VPVKMSDESLSFERTVALERREYWERVYQNALETNDESAAAQAQRFVQEYDEFIRQLDLEHQ